MGLSPTVIRLVVSATFNSGWDFLTNPYPPGTEQLAEFTGDYKLAKLTVGWDRTPAVGVVQDKAMCTFHFLNLTGDAPDDTWTTTDFSTVEGMFDAFWDDIKVKVPAEVRLSEYSWRYDGPSYRPHGEDFSPTIRITSRSSAGTYSGATVLPPQCAMSVTEVTPATYVAYGVGVPGSVPGTGRTQLRNRWGRFYLPGFPAQLLTDGRWTSSECTIISGFVKDFYNDCVGSSFIPVMYSPTTGDSWSITDIHVDDLVDVVRSRRYTDPLTRAPNAIDTP